MNISTDQTSQERYRALLQAARNLFSLTNLDDLVEHVLKHSRLMMQCEACSIFLPDRITQELILYSARGKEDAYHSLRIPWDRGIAGLCFQEKKFIRIDDAENDPRIFRQATKKDGNTFITKAMLCAPLVDRNDCFGVIQAINPIGHIFFTELDEEIFEGLTNIITGALVRFDRERKIQAQSKLDRELNVAMEIQKSFLPPEETILPYAEVRTRYKPARTIGGDFYSVMALPEDRLLVAIGDVSGKGIPAALTTAMIAGEMSAMVGKLHENLSSYVSALNDSLCRRFNSGRFAATTFLLHDPHAQSMKVVCAGQFEPMRCQTETWERLNCRNDLPLGIVPGHTYEEATFCCEPGEKWLLFSDGINEGRSRDGTDYGMEKLQESLQSSPACAASLLDRVWNQWSSFVDLEHQHDDACITLLVTKPTPELKITSCTSQCKHARNYIERWAQAAGFPDLERGTIVLAADEAVTNIIRHTYAGSPNKTIILSGELTKTDLHLSLRDYGPPVDPAKLKGRDLDDIKPGGLGLHLLQMVFPVVEHKVLPDGNYWHLAKPLPQSAGNSTTVT